MQLTTSPLLRPPPHQMKLITPSALVERLKIGGSLARAAIKELEGEEMIKRLSYHSSQWVYTRATAVEA